MIIDMPELGAMNAKQAASLAGLAPVTRQSGTWEGKARISGGRGALRTMLFMPAVSNPLQPATRSDLSCSLRSRKAVEGRDHRRDAQACHPRQRLDP
jgi:transposase